MSKRIPVVALVVAVIAALIVPKGALAAEDEIPPTVVEEGHHTYLNLCASCHGKSGKGDGPMAPELVNKPIDLTQIARKNSGKFPFWHVYQTIDGRRIPRAHGGAGDAAVGEQIRNVLPQHSDARMDARGHLLPGIDPEEIGWR